MLNMENAEEVMQILERFTRLKQKEIPKELDDYMHYVAKTGDTVFKWSSLKYLFREKLLNVIKNFHDTSPRVDDLPQYPNVDPFNYESMKSSLLERLELFNAAPFTVQRLCELLTEPRKQYSRIDKFMRALEKNILVSTIEPGRKQTESENGDSLDSVVNGDVSLDVNVDIEMENETIFNAADAQNNATPSETTPAQPSSNLIHKSDDDILPNPKKAKLDLDENNDAEIEAATKSITSNKSEIITIVPSVEVTMAEETTDSTEKKQNEEPVSEDKPAAVENVVESIKKDNKDAEHEKMEEDLPASAPIDETKDEAKSDVKESEKKPEEKDVTPVPASTALVVQEESEQPKTGVESTIDTADTNIKAVEKESADKKEECSQEKTAEKTKEVAEKENATNEEARNGDVKPSELKTETNTTIETTNDKQSGMVVEEHIVDSASEKKTENAETAETSVTVASVEKQVESEVVSTLAAQSEAKNADVKVADEAMATSEEKSKPVEEKKAAVENSTVMEVDAAAQAKIITTESPQNDSVAKEDEVKSTEVTEKETDKPEVVDSAALEAPISKEPVVEAPVEKAVDSPSVEATPSVVEKAAIVEKAEAEKVSVEQPATEQALVEKAEVAKVDADKAEIEKTATDKQVVEKPAIEMSEKETPATVETPTVTPPTDDSPAPIASSETKSEVTTPTPAVTPPAAVVEAPSTVTPAIEPVITADQPMEENPELIAEAEPVVPAIVVEAATTVEEVVMGGDSVEMATDAIEPAKDEPAGMEVDDTSQEAMDQ